MKIALHGCYDIANFGDVLLAEMLASKVQETFNIEPVVPMIGRKGKAKWITKFENANYCIWGGGGYFCDQNTSKANISHFGKYLLPAMFMRTRKIPYSILCPGAGPLTSIVGRSSTRLICQGARHIIVRDEESRSIISSTGVQYDRIKVAADFVLSLDPQNIPAIARDAASHLLGSSSPGTLKLVGIHLESMYRECTSDCTKLIQWLLHYADLNPNIKLIFISDHSTEIHKTYSQLIASHSTSAEAHVSIPRQDTWTTLAILEKLDAVLTSKLHVGIAAYTVGTPIFGLWTHPKTPRFYRSINRYDSQANYAKWEASMPQWMNRINSETERNRFNQEYTHKAHFQKSIETAFDTIADDIRNLYNLGLKKVA